MTAQPNRVWKEADVQKKAWTKPVIRRIDTSPELLELFGRIHEGEAPKQLEPLKRRIAAMMKQDSSHS